MSGLENSLLLDCERARLACISISHRQSAEARDTTALTSMRLLAEIEVRSITKRLAPRPDGPLMHFTSSSGVKCRLGIISQSDQIP